MSSEAISDIYVHCANCSTTKSLRDAVIEDWKFCRICSMIFCPQCASKILSQSLCFGSRYTKLHKAKFDMLPVDEILNFSKELQRRPKEGKFISRLFYDKRMKILIKQQKKSRITAEEAMIIRYREEQWKKFGTVLVKRKDGKFITWGQIE